jgi:hypothetical protein
MHDEWEAYVQRAGREFVAAGRATTSEQRRQLRESAEHCQDMARRLREDTPRNARRSF